MRRILTQARKDLTQLVRDRLALALALGLPVGLAALLGTTISLTVTDIPLVVQDLDRSPLSRQYVDAFRASLTFRLVPLPLAQAPDALLATGEARAALVVPEDFARRIRRGRIAEAQLLVDATDGNTALLARGAAVQVTRAFARQLGGPESGPRLRTATRLWFNPGRDPGRFYGPGMFVLALSIFPPLLAALSMAREGEQRTILQVYVSSISAHEFLLGKVLAGLVVALAEWLLVLGLLFGLFGLRLAGDPTPFLAASVLFLFCMVSFGALAGAAIPNQAAAIQVVAMGGFLLAFLLSGLIFPVENIPPGLAWISNLVQARYFIVVVRDAFLQGGGWPAVGWAVAAIGAIGAVYFALAWLTLRRMQLRA